MKRLKKMDLDTKDREAEAFLQDVDLLTREGLDFGTLCEEHSEKETMFDDPDDRVCSEVLTEVINSVCLEDTKRQLLTLEAKKEMELRGQVHVVREELLLSDTRVNAMDIYHDENDRTILYWTQRNGVFGYFDLESREIKQIHHSLANPLKLSCTNNNHVYVLEQGHLFQYDGALSVWHIKDSRFHIVKANLNFPLTMAVTPSRRILILYKHESKDTPASSHDEKEGEKSDENGDVVKLDGEIKLDICEYLTSTGKDRTIATVDVTIPTSAAECTSYNVNDACFLPYDLNCDTDTGGRLLLSIVFMKNDTKSIERINKIPVLSVIVSIPVIVELNPSSEQRHSICGPASILLESKRSRNIRKLYMQQTKRNAVASMLLVDDGETPSKLNIPISSSAMAIAKYEFNTSTKSSGFCLKDHLFESVAAGEKDWVNSIMSIATDKSGRIFYCGKGNRECVQIVNGRHHSRGIRVLCPVSTPSFPPTKRSIERFRTIMLTDRPKPILPTFDKAQQSEVVSSPVASLATSDHSSTILDTVAAEDHVQTDELDEKDEKEEGEIEKEEEKEEEETKTNSNINVVVRCRPLFQHEIDIGAHNVVTCTYNDVKLSSKEDWRQPKEYKFNRVYGPSSRQSQIFEDQVYPLVLKAIDGFNCTVFAYGQTGTGKTYTMEGSLNRRLFGENEEDEEQLKANAGMIPRAILTIFDVMQMYEKKGMEWSVSVSHLEIYQEELIDLMGPPLVDEEENERKKTREEILTTTSKLLYKAAQRRGIQMKYVPLKEKKKKELQNALRKEEEEKAAQAKNSKRQPKRKKLPFIRETAGKIFVENLTETYCQTADSVFQLLEQSLHRRMQAETLLNKLSSRSHSIFSIKIRSQMPGNQFSTERTGILNLVDLSGSENLKKSGSVGDRKSEACHINRGLHALGRVIKAKNTRGAYIPFRDSKLTRILKESLGGNCLTTIILAVSPNHRDIDETSSTMAYASAARMIKTKPKKNKVVKKIVHAGEENSQIDDSNLEMASHDKLAGTDVVERKNVIPVRPWEGRIPIRKPKRVVDKKNQGGDDEESKVLPDERVLDGDHVDWVATAMCKDDDNSRELVSNDAKEMLREIYAKTSVKRLNELYSILRGNTPRLYTEHWPQTPATQQQEKRKEEDRSHKRKDKIEEEEVTEAKLPLNTFIAVFSDCAKRDPSIAYKILPRLGYNHNFVRSKKKGKRMPKQLSRLLRMNRSVDSDSEEFHARLKLWRWLIKE
eukprot:g2120.t1